MLLNLRYVFWPLGLILACGVLSEGAARLSRVADVPLYVVDQRVGYVPAPNQAGAVLWRNDWAFNALSMATSQPFTGHGVLLIGDSVVCGGNPFRQRERMAEQLEKRLGRDVWPVCAGGWSLDNELAYVALHPEIETADRIVFLINPGDDQPGSSWLGEIGQPTHHPAIALSYAFERWVRKNYAPTGTKLPPWRPRMRALIARNPGKVIFAFYPNLKGGDFSPFQGMAPEIRITLRRDQYRDFTHPTAAGTASVADQLAKALR